MTLERAGEAVDMSHAQLGRIERGLQPYNQELLEAPCRAIPDGTGQPHHARPDQRGRHVVALGPSPNRARYSPDILTR
jgi:hypothetical protein